MSCLRIRSVCLDGQCLGHDRFFGAVVRCVVFGAQIMEVLLGLVQVVIGSDICRAVFVDEVWLQA